LVKKPLRGREGRERKEIPLDAKKGISASFGVFSLFFSLSSEVKVDERPAVEFKKLLDIDRVEPLMINSAWISGMNLTDRDDDENLLRSSGTAAPGAVADVDV